MNDNRKSNILMSENIKQKRLTILEYFDAYIFYAYIFGLLFIYMKGNSIRILQKDSKSFLRIYKWLSTKK